MKQDYMRYNRELQEKDEDEWKFVIFREYSKVHFPKFN